MKFWSKLPSGGAAISPATAPRPAARPQPRAIVQLTRMPARRLESGFRAAARIASPILVNRKKSQRTNTAPSETAMIPKSAIEKATPAMWIGRVENGLGIDFSSGDQIHEAAPLTTKKSATVSLLIVIRRARTSDLIPLRSSPTPPANDARTVAR